jgi:hypothetical protein
VGCVLIVVFIECDGKELRQTVIALDGEGVSPVYLARGAASVGGTAGGMQLLLRAAGRNQMRGLNSRKEFGAYWKGPPYGDDPRDQLMIDIGINYYKQGCH